MGSAAMIAVSATRRGIGNRLQLPQGYKARRYIGGGHVLGDQQLGYVVCCRVVEMGMCIAGDIKMHCEAISKLEVAASMGL